MRFTIALLAAVMILLLSVPAMSQTFQQCADVTQNGTVSVSDMVYMINVFLGSGPPLPVGRGDIDFRQNFNLGDLRYLIGYIFMGYLPGGCPPFSSYTLGDAPDSIYLPEVTVPDGSGSVVIPIVISNSQIMSELLLTTRMVATNCTAVIDSVGFVQWAPQSRFYRKGLVDPNELSILWSCLYNGELTPGSRTVAAIYVHYSGAVGGVIRLEPANFDAIRFSHEINGSLELPYSSLNISIPRIVVRLATQMATMSVAPDSLYFVILSGSGDPAPQSFTITSDGDPFAWSATAPAWAELSSSLGVSGASVTVQPHTDTLTPGSYVDKVTVSSNEALNSPVDVKLVLRVLPQYPSFDANCDGKFNVSDIVRLILYIFGGQAPCDPCAAK